MGSCCRYEAVGPSSVVTFSFVPEMTAFVQEESQNRREYREREARLQHFPEDYCPKYGSIQTQLQSNDSCPGQVHL